MTTPMTEGSPVAPKARRAITALQLQVEITPYNEAGQVLPRPIPFQVSVFEADIPPEVLDWVRGLMAKRDYNG